MTKDELELAISLNDKLTEIRLDIDSINNSELRVQILLVSTGYKVRLYSIRKEALESIRGIILADLLESQKEYERKFHAI